MSDPRKTYEVLYQPEYDMPNVPEGQYFTYTPATYITYVKAFNVAEAAELFTGRMGPTNHILKIDKFTEK
jgi:hypothetical protein